MATSDSEHADALHHQITDLLQVRQTLIATVLDARAAYESGKDKRSLQVLLSASVKDVEDVDHLLHVLRDTESELS